MKRSLLFLALAIAMPACESITVKHLKKLSRIDLYGNDYAGWRLFQVADDYAVTKTDNDTLKTMRYTLDEDGMPLINFYEEIFRCGSDTCYLNMRDLDTLYFYTKSGNTKMFEVGEYAYKYTYLELVGDEIRYYELYEDSLQKVRGSNLPKLPVLTDAELKLYEQKFK